MIKYREKIRRVNEIKSTIAELIKSSIKLDETTTTTKGNFYTIERDCPYYIFITSELRLYAKYFQLKKYNNLILNNEPFKTISGSEAYLHEIQSWNCTVGYYKSAIKKLMEILEPVELSLACKIKIFHKMPDEHLIALENALRKSDQHLTDND